MGKSGMHRVASTPVLPPVVPEVADPEPAMRVAVLLDRLMLYTLVVVDAYSVVSAELRARARVAESSDTTVDTVPPLSFFTLTFPLRVRQASR